MAVRLSFATMYVDPHPGMKFLQQRKDAYHRLVRVRKGWTLKWFDDTRPVFNYITGGE